MSSNLEDAEVWAQLSSELVHKIASGLHPKDVLSLTCVNKHASSCLNEDIRLFSRQRVRTLRLFEPGRPRECSELLLAQQPWPGTDFVAHWGRPEPWRALNRRERHRLLCLAASSLHPPSLDAAITHCGTVIKAEALASAAAAGDLAACEQLLHSAWFSPSPDMPGWKALVELLWSAAAGNGHHHILQGLADMLAQPWLGSSPAAMQAARSSRVVAAAAAAARGGQRETLAWLLGDAVIWTDELMQAAAEGGQVELLQEMVAASAEAVGWSRHLALCCVAYGCLLDALQSYNQLWGPDHLQGQGPEEAAHKRHAGYYQRWVPAHWRAPEAWSRQQLLLRALASPTPDWEPKCDWLLTQLGLAAGCLAKPELLHPQHQSIKDLAKLPDCAQRCQYAVRRGLADSRQLLPVAAEAAAAAGNVAAVAVCLDHVCPPQPSQPSQTAAAGGTQAAHQLSGSGGSGQQSAGSGGEQELAAGVREGPQLTPEEFRELQGRTVEAAVEHNQFHVLGLLCQRRGAALHRAEDVSAAAASAAAASAAAASAAATSAAAASAASAAAANAISAAAGAGARAAPAGAAEGQPTSTRAAAWAAAKRAAAAWATERAAAERAAAERAAAKRAAEAVEAVRSDLFSKAARHGADLRLLRYLHEQRGAAIDLPAIAQGGSEEQLEWAVEKLRAAGQLAAAQPPISFDQFRNVLKENRAAADWLYRNGIALRDGLAYLFHRLVNEVPYDFSSLPPLKWAAGHYCTQWSHKRRSMLAALRDKLQDNAAPRAHLQWLREMVAAADAALGVQAVAER